MTYVNHLIKKKAVIERRNSESRGGREPMRGTGDKAGAWRR